jgi:hypothetical protein
MEKTRVTSPKFGYQHFPFGKECWHIDYAEYLHCDRVWRIEVGQECSGDREAMAWEGVKKKAGVHRPNSPSDPDLWPSTARNTPNQGEHPPKAA